MTHTLAAVFETRAEASLAKDELVHSGYDIDTIQINDSGSVAGTARIDDDASILGTVKNLFSQLIGKDHDDRHVYAEALNRGHVVLTVETASLEAADRAADIVDNFNPIDIDEHETMWRASGWTGAEVLRSGPGMQQTSLGALQSAPEQHGIRPREEAVEFARSEQGLLTQGSLQRGDAGGLHAVPGNGDPLADIRNTVQRSGMRIYPVERGPNQDSLRILRGDDATDDPDDTYFRSHWEKTYSYTGGTYQDFDPAYRYGESMAGSPAYKERPWEEAEPELRNTWESTHPQSSWDKFKAAVREGWERMTR